MFKLHQKDVFVWPGCCCYCCCCCCLCCCCCCCCCLAGWVVVLLQSINISNSFVIPNVSCTASQYSLISVLPTRLCKEINEQIMLIRAPLKEKLNLRLILKLARLYKKAKTFVYNPLRMLEIGSV